MERRLAAILAADVAGYTHLTELDDESSAATLRLYRGVVEEIIGAHHGRAFGVAGDSICAEFPSIVEAIRCAVEIQHEIADRNAAVDEDKRMQLRIGVNLGDVIAEGDGLFGTGVNLASRLGQLAEPGGVCVSQTVYDQVRRILEVQFQDIGQVRLKNIEEPVRVYRIQSMPLPWFRRVLSRGRGRRRTGLATAALLLVAAIAGAAFLLTDQAGIRSRLFEDRPTIPEQPSLAILPFDDLGPDGAQQYLADGITQELITGLARFPNLIVAHHATSADAGGATNIQEVGKDLNVRYVVTGSLQRSDQDVRITAQLIDAATGRHIWADRYDRELSNIFDIRDEIMRSVVATIVGKLSAAEVARLSTKDPTSFTAYDHVARGWHEWEQFTPENNLAARELFEKARAIDPGYANAYAGLAWSYSSEYDFGWADDYDRTLGLALEMAESAVRLDNNDYRSHWVRGWALMYSRQHDKALASYRRALELNPNDSELLAEMASILVYVGHAQEAIDQIEEAMRINPNHDEWYELYLGWAYEDAGKPEKAIAVLEPVIDPNPTEDELWALPTLASAYADPKVGRLDDARRLVEQILAMNPEFTIEDTLALNPYKTGEQAERAAGAMRRAGLPN